MEKCVIRKPYLILSIITVIIIWTNSLLPASLSSVQSGFFVSLAGRIFDFIGIGYDLEILSWVIRKLAHFGQFLVLGILLCLTFYHDKYRYRWVIIIAVFVAIMDETIQVFSPGRHFSLLDILIDVAGALFGMMFVSCLRK